jgi:hypothetical protein
MASVEQILKGIAASVAVAAATATGGPAAGASMAAFLASPAGQRTMELGIQQSAAANGVVLEDLARGGLVTMPTLGLTGEAGPEMVIPLKKRKRRKNPKLKKALTEANRRLRTKSGRLRKGKTQADVMRLAHRLMKKMK